MTVRNNRGVIAWALLFGSLTWVTTARGQVPLEGFLPMVGFGLTNEFEDSTDPSSSATFFIAKPRNQPGGRGLGVGNSTYYDLALLDTGAATHILTPQAYAGFDILSEGFDGTNFQQIGGATGTVDLLISDPLGVYAGPLSGASVAGNQLTMNRSVLRGQTSFSVLSGDENWTLPNVIGLPMAAHHKVTIRSDQPQIFSFQGRTVRSPNVTFGTLGTGDNDILRRAQLNLRPGIGFVQGPLYVANLDFTSFTLHENPMSPSVVENGGLYIEADFVRGEHRLDDQEFLFDTGASLTVVSQQTAVRLGFDPLLDTPDFTLQVEGSGGVSGNVPGFYVDQFRLDTIGGSFVLENVPVAVLDVTSPNDPGNIVDGILGMNVFAGRNLTIDAIPQIGQGGLAPSLYISDPVTQHHAWAATAATANWTAGTSWSSPAGVPGSLAQVRLANVRGSAQVARLTTQATVFGLSIAGAPNAEMTLRVGSEGQLITFAEVAVQNGGVLELDGGAVDAQYVELTGGALAGNGSISVGSGPITSAVRNTGGVIAPGSPNGDSFGTIDIRGDLANDGEGIMAFDLGGTQAGVTHDQVQAERFAFLGGTLEVSLTELQSGRYEPSTGSSFTLLVADEGRQGTFDALVLPRGYQWDVDYNASDVTLTVLGPAAVTGDLNGDAVMNCHDVDLITAAVRRGSTASVYDMNADGTIDARDIEHWVTQDLGTLMGDANLDGTVDDIDLSVWMAHRYTNADGWCQGDFDGDGYVDGSDFNLWNANKYRSSNGLAAVPEPRVWAALLGALLLTPVRRRREKL